MSAAWIVLLKGAGSKKCHRLPFDEDARFRQQFPEFRQRAGRFVQLRGEALPVLLREADALVFQDDPLGLRKDPVHNKLRDIHPEQFGGSADDALFVRINPQIDPGGNGSGAHGRNLCSIHTMSTRFEAVQPQTS